METGLEFCELLKKLKKNELVSIIKDYNQLANIYKYEKLKNTNAKKDILIKNIKEIKDNYLKSLIELLDIEDFLVLKEIIKKVDNETLNEHRDLINYLVDKRVLFQNDNLVIPSDFLDNLKRFVKSKEVINGVKLSDKIYKLSDGIVIAYGVVEKKYFDDITCEYGDLIYRLDFYYKKSYKVSTKMVVSEKLTNKQRINKYFKNKKCKKFNVKDFVLLGNSNYHHGIKAYKNFIKMLKSNYVFKNSDIEFIDKNIVIPYLYNSINEEEIANKNLEETVVELFEFKGEKLKNKMLAEIKKIRCDFPLWEYRGNSKNEGID